MSIGVKWASSSSVRIHCQAGRASGESLMVGGVGSFEGWTVGFWAKVGGFMRLGNLRYVAVANF